MDSRKNHRYAGIYLDEARPGSAGIDEHARRPVFPGARAGRPRPGRISGPRESGAARVAHRSQRRRRAGAARGGIRHLKYRPANLPEYHRAARNHQLQRQPMKLRKRFILFGALAVVVLAGVTSAVVYGLREPAEPTYEGKPLSEVLLACATGQGNYDTDYKRAEAAIAEFGTNAVPTLLRMLRVKDSGLRFELDKVERKLGLIRKAPVPARTKNEAAAV